MEKVGKAGRRDGCRRERQIGAREMGERLGKEAVDSVDKYLSTSNGKEMPYVLLYMTDVGKVF